MLFLQFGDVAGSGPRGGLLGVVIAAAAQQGRRRGDEAGDDRERERRVEAVLEGPEIRFGKNDGPVSAA